MASNDLLKVSNFSIILGPDTQPIELQVVNANLPGFTLGTLDIARPVVRDKRPGDQLDYNDLELTILCDEDLEAWKKIYYYLVLAADPNSGNLEINKTVFDAVLNITTNKNNIQHSIKFRNAYFKSLGDIAFDTTSSEEESLTFSTSLGYSFFDFE